MEFIEKDEALFELIKSGKVRVRDAQITRFNFFIDEASLLIIEIDLDHQYGKGDQFKLRFSDIKEYGVYWNSTRTFYNIEQYTLLKKEGLYQISFDPYDEWSTVVSENDNDFILFGSFEAYKIN